MHLTCSPARLFVIALLFVAATTASAQWTPDCQSPDYPRNSYFSTVQIAPAVPPYDPATYYRLYQMDSLSIRIYSYNHYCVPMLETTYWLNDLERLAGYRTLGSTGQDLNGDGRYELWLQWGYDLPYPADSWGGFKLFDIFSGAIAYITSENHGMHYGMYSVAEVDGDGILECVIRAADANSGVWHYELLNTGVSAGVGGTAPAPSEFTLEQNFPNPFNPATRINYQIERAGHVALDVYNALGQRVHTLVNRWEPQGAHAVDWNGADERGIPVASGTYYYQLLLNGRAAGARQMVMLR